MQARAIAVCLLVWALGLPRVFGTPDDPDVGSTGSRPELIEGRPIDTGYVVLCGEYVRLPYVVGRRGREVYVNGRPVATLRAWRRGRQGSEGRVGSRRLASSGPKGDREGVVARIEETLINEGLVLAVDRETVILVSPQETTLVLDTLMCNRPDDAKVELLMLSVVQGISSAEWAQVVRDFEPADELRRRWGQHMDVVQAAWLPPPPEPAPATPHLSESTTYAITVAGMALAVLAFGTLLMYRPSGHLRWRDLDSSGEGVPLVFRNVGLVATLSLFDLGCTLLANRSGAFWEMNPLGSHLGESPYALAGFKISTLLVSSIILLTLRRYRGAQTASWWLCLLCTVVTFRWTTFTSMFLT